jgi:hypothetical protein
MHKSPPSAAGVEHGVTRIRRLIAKEHLDHAVDGFSRSRNEAFHGLIEDLRLNSRRNHTPSETREKKWPCGFRLHTQ